MPIKFWSEKVDKSYKQTWPEELRGPAMRSETLSRFLHIPGSQIRRAVSCARRVPGGALNRRGFRPGMYFRASLMAALMLALPGFCAPPAPVDEYEVKAAMLLNLARFVQTPRWKAGNTRAALVIGVLAPRQVVAQVQEVLTNRTLGTQPVVVQELQSLAGAGKCNIVFIARSAPAQYQSVAALSKTGIVTVGDAEGFAQDGGIIGMVVRQEHVALEINLRAAHDDGITISSRVLALATIVEGSP